MCFSLLGSSHFLQDTRIRNALSLRHFQPSICRASLYNVEFSARGIGIGMCVMCVHTIQKKRFPPSVRLGFWYAQSLSECLVHPELKQTFLNKIRSLLMVSTVSWREMGQGMIGSREDAPTSRRRCKEFSCPRIVLQRVCIE